jgi:hypothetical protein
MMFDKEYFEKRFAKHIAKLSDYGAIKVLDFSKPDTCMDAIRFIFDEEKYTLFISGDLGELVAYNFNNMVLSKFMSDFADDPDYFRGKVECSSRPMFYYDEEKAREELLEMVPDLEDDDFEEIFQDFDDHDGIGYEGYQILDELIDDACEARFWLGHRPTDYVELYLLAFKLAIKQLGEETKA